MSGIKVSNENSILSAGSSECLIGGKSLFDDGRKPMNLLNWNKASTSFSKAKSDTPDFFVWVEAPPNSSWLTSSWVTVFSTSGPVTNMYDVSLTMKIKSVIAGL